MRKLGRYGMVAAVCVVFAMGAWLGTALADRSATAPPIVYSGQILTGGAPVADTAHVVELALFSSASGPTGGLCDNGSSSVTTIGGHFSLSLNEACANVFETEEAVYVDLTVDGTHLTTRARAGAVPYAVTAEHAQDLRAPRRIAATAGTYTGRIADATLAPGLLGYAAARAICQSTLGGSPSAHLCYDSELARARQEGLVVPLGVAAPETPVFDTAGGGAAPWVDQFDCGGFTSAVDACGTSATCIRYVFGSGPTNCSGAAPLICCD